MQLTVMERLALLAVLPAKAKIADGRIVLDLKQAAGFTEAERAAINLREVPGMGLMWDYDPGKEVEVGKRALEIISEALAKLDEAGQVPIDCISLYDKVESAKKANV